MSPHHACDRPHLLAALTLLLTPFVSPLSAQNPTVDVSRALVAAMAPAIDDYDRTARELITAALANERSPLAWILIEELTNSRHRLQDTAAVQALLPVADGARRHGLLEQKLAELRWYLEASRRGDVLAGDAPDFGYARSALVVGPLGDAGDHFTGVVLAPELDFPALGGTLPGRGTTARVRVSTPRFGSAFLQLQDPSRPLPGCYYARLQCRVDQDVDCFLEIDYPGDSQVFVDDQEVHRVERWRRGGLRRTYVALTMPAGVHDVLVKTCTANNQHLAVRWLDAEGRPQAGLRWLAPEAPAARVERQATTNGTSFVAAGDALARAAARPDAETCVVLAALWCAVDGDHDEAAVDLADRLQQAPPQDPGEGLAWAQLVRRVPLPDELRKAAARAAIEAAAAALPPTHFAAVMAKTDLLGEQDQREQALRLCAALPPGPETFARRLDLLRNLRFTAEVEPLLQAWAAACPHDPRPLANLAQERRDSADSRQMLELRRQALQRRNGLADVTLQSVRNALDLGDCDGATALLDQLLPKLDAWPSEGRRRWEIEIELSRGDRARAASLLEQLRADPDASADAMRDAATSWLQLGDRAAAIRCLERALEIDADQPQVRNWLAALGAGPTEDQDFLPFRRDGAAAVASFVAGDREQGAAMTVVLEQRILVLRPDGSAVLEGHELRRINDQTGVDAFRENNDFAHLEEVLLVRTHAPDGKVYVPSRIDDNYALQRLEPGSFVEWRYREHLAAPGAEPLSTDAFVFGSEELSTLTSEFVLVTPPQFRGELRLRELTEASEQQTLADGRRVRIFRQQDLAALPKERFLPSLMELRPSAQVGEDTTPFATLRDMRAELLARSTPTAPIRAIAERELAGLPDARARAAAAWSWVQREIEDGQSGSALETLLRKKGNRVLLCAALLRAAGVEVLPMACAGAREDLTGGLATLFPEPRGADVPGAVVRTDDGGRICLFADAPRHWPLGAVPAVRAGTMAWQLGDGLAERFVLPANDDAAQTLRVRGKARVDGDKLRLEVEAEIGDQQGFMLAHRVSQLKENVQKLAARQVAQQLFPSWRVTKASMTETKPGEPLRLVAALERGGVQQHGTGFVAPLPLPPSRLVTLYGDRKERTLPYHLTTDERTEWDITLDPGQDLRIVAVPPPLAGDQGPLRYTFTVSRDGGALRLQRSLRLRSAQLAAADFPSWLRLIAAIDHAEQATIELAPRQR